MWEDILSDSISFRRELHQNPELTWKEVQTAERIRKKLDTLNIPWVAMAKTGTLARLAVNAPGKHVALRGDIDALPIDECSGKDWRSNADGCMHACGHDGHTATLYAAAAWLKLNESDLPGPVSLLFQPAEEGGHGAKAMIDDGALAGVDEIYGWHNWPAIPFGRAVCPEGSVMSANSAFKIKVNGRGGHASQPEKCHDPVLASAAIVMALQQLVSRRVAPQTAVVVSVTSIDAISANNVIRKDVTLSGGIRAADTKVRDEVCELFSKIVSDTAQAYNCHAEVDHQIYYAATVNHANQSAKFRSALSEEFGEQWLDSLPVPIMASEDFSYYLNEIPGAFALVGSGLEGQDSPPCHSPYYDFNDDLIAHVVRLYARLVGAPVP